MPHVIVKLYPGRSEAQKAKLAEDVAKAVMDSLGCSEASLSIGVEEVAAADWAETVYRPDITGKPATIYKKPGYPAP